MKDAELAAAADANYAAAFRALAPIALDGAAEELDGVLLVRVGVPVSLFNVAFVRAPLADPTAAIRHSIGYFDAHGLPFHVRIREGVDEEAERQAVAHGLEPSGTQPGMCLHPIRSHTSATGGLRIEVVDRPEKLDVYLQTMSEGSGMPVEIARRVFVADRVHGLDGATLYLGYVDGAPACTSALIMGPDDVAGVYNVATLDPFRRQGLGEAMTWRAISDGERAGATVATLQASEMGKPIYERMGFRTVAPYRIYTHPS